MKRIVSIILVILCWTSLLHAQSLRVAEILRSLSMENISVTEKQDTITAAFETSAYRGGYNGIGVAIRHLLAMSDLPTLQLVLLEGALPQLCITLPANLIHNYQSGKCTLEDVYRLMSITTSTRSAMRHLKDAKREQSSFGKIDLVLYPGVMLVNNVTYKLYKAALDLQPALEMQLWKGASLRMQVSLPIVNNEEGKWDCVRLGFMTLRQDFRLLNHWKGFVTGGSFSNDRQGLAAGIGYFSANGRWTIEGEGGITGSSHFYGSDWSMSKWKRLNGRFGVGYYVPEVNTQVKIDGGRFLYGDYGVRGSLSRYFGECIVGIYGMYTDGTKNAGFYFSIPLPGKKRKRHAVRVMLPEYFSFQYDMRSGNEYTNRSLGESYNTEPKSAEISRFRQPDYIRYFLIRTSDKRKIE